MTWFEIAISLKHYELMKLLIKNWANTYEILENDDKLYYLEILIILWTWNLWSFDKIDHRKYRCVIKLTEDMFEILANCIRKHMYYRGNFTSFSQICKYYHWEENINVPRRNDYEISWCGMFSRRYTKYSSNYWENA